MNNVSFQSRIRPVCPEEFAKKAISYGAENHVGCPWTVRQTVINDKAFTTGVLDCTVCGFTDGKKVMLMHLSPALSENKNFAHIFNVIKKRLNGFNFNKECLQGFLLGSKPKRSPGSEEIIDTLAKYMEERNIPYSMFRGGPYENHVAYSAEMNEWLITNKDIDRETLMYNKPKALMERMFDDVKISHLDELV